MDLKDDQEKKGGRLRTSHTDDNCSEIKRLIKDDCRINVCEIAEVTGIPARGLFRDGPGNFEPRSDDEDDIWVGTPLSKLSRHANGRTFGHYVGFGEQQAPYTADRQWNQVSNYDSPAPRSRPYH
ncbi:hypothetical protein AVEN_75310-1 [Araneus ventricosus]|uniref:Uncharacterized protein n=1 Tax=Araneus ventricosus TaxID=182803 RepID=A0A4Y2G5A1_ARAVE|nr:hypothetical protein AVEN_75310-1 [Araneus ventricosus]